MKRTLSRQRQKGTRVQVNPGMGALDPTTKACAEVGVRHAYATWAILAAAVERVFNKPDDPKVCL